MSNNAHELSNRLLNALDNNYNVVDMQAVNEIISILERFNITKELLETTRLGKHVNELRRKTTDPTLARRAKVLVKRWRDLVIPTVTSPGHTGSNRSSAERSVRRLAGTPLTSPALSRVVSPAVVSPRPPSRPAWGGYESDSQDVILVDDDPPPPPAPPPALHLPFKPVTPPVKRPPSPEPLFDDKKAKRDKKPKKRRGHSRAGSGTETVAGVCGAVGAGLAGAMGVVNAGAGAWGARNGSSTHGDRRRNGWRRDAPDACSALVKRLPPVGAKKVKTTKELLEQLQSRKGPVRPRVPSPRASPPRSPASPDVMVIEPDPCPVARGSPLRNGDVVVPAAPAVFPLEDERVYPECTCGDVEGEGEEGCPAARRLRVHPLHVQLLHNALLPGVNGTRAPVHPHQYAVRRAAHPDRAGLFASVVPLYKYSDYADDACVKNVARVPLCDHMPWTEFAPPPPDPPPPPPTPPPRPYPPPEPDDAIARPEPDETSPRPELDSETPGDSSAPGEESVDGVPKMEPESVDDPGLEPSERLKAPPFDPEEDARTDAEEAPAEPPPAELFALEPCDHRTVERTKAEPERELDGRALLDACGAALRAAHCTYAHALAAPSCALADEPDDEATLRAALAAADDERDELGRPARPARFAEWHECARLGDLLALPYVVID